MYTYHVEAVVTDEAGETQSASYNLLAGPKAYSFDVRLPQYVCKEDSMLFTFRVNNMMNVPQDMKGSYYLYPLTERDRGRNIGDSDPLTDVILEGDFMANRLQDFSAWNKLPSGNYRLKLSVRDSLGREENNGAYGSDSFMLFSKSDKCPAAFTDFFYYKENEEFDVQHPAAFLLGTSYRDAYVLMDVFCERKRIESRVLQLNDTIIRMEFPYKEAYGKGITVLFSFVKDGEMYNHQVELKKRQPERALGMKWEVFRDRLHPGQEEEWKLVIKTPQGMPAAAEMLATMYDASLDKIYKSNQILRVFYPDNLYGAFRGASRYNSNYFSIYFPLKAWRVPVWSFDHFCSPYMDGRMRIVMVEDNALLEEVSVVGYGTTRNGSLTGNLRIRGANQPMLASKAESGNAVEVKYVPAQVVEDVVFESETIPVGEALQPIEGLRTNFAETAFFILNFVPTNKGSLHFPLRCRRV